MKRALLILQLFAFCQIAIGQEQEEQDSRCEWAQCQQENAPSSPQFTDTDSTAEPTPQKRLHECEREDDLACKDECRTKFDNEFHRCHRDCMDAHCVKKSARTDDDPGSPRASRAECVETAGPDCETSCKKSSPQKADQEKTDSSLQARQCRRQCLQERCPNANGIDIADEANSPGSLRCKRCKEDNKITCQRNCMLGTMAYPHQGSALEQLGCEKLCAMTTCDEECGGVLGF